MRASAMCLAVCLLAACEESEEERNAPPVGSSAGQASTATAGATSGMSDTAAGESSASSAGTNGTTMGSTTTPVDETTGGPSTFVVISGTFEDGGGEYELPIDCSVQFHLPGQIDPTSGQADAFVFSWLFTIEAFPQPYSLTNDDVSNFVEMGDVGFVASRCDVDGNQLFDDNFGGFFPALPMSEVTIPASDVNLSVGPL